MKTYLKTVTLLKMICLLAITTCTSVAASDTSNQQKYPNQYQSWQATSEQVEREDMLANYPASIILWAGSSYAKEYHSPRGHHFAVADVTHTLRTGVPPLKQERKDYPPVVGPARHRMPLD
ncbi:hypothetical protein SMBr_15240 [Shewanella sp. M-Br]|nr:hypothetical protein SMBr_15240 [Shewanella sp. M-Br]